MVLWGRSGGLPGTTWAGQCVQLISGSGQVTLSMTFSSELGQSMAKQTKMMSVSG
jgi:hypothetical protein